MPGGIPNDIPPVNVQGEGFDALGKRIPTLNVPRPNAADVGSPNVVRRGPFRNPPLKAPDYPGPRGPGGGKKLFRGWLLEGDVNNPYPMDQRYRFDFHYNPETLAESWSVDTSTAQPPQSNTKEQQAPGLGPSYSTINFTLVLDRTIVRTPHGVLDDVNVLIRLFSAGQSGFSPYDDQASAGFVSGGYLTAVFGRSIDPNPPSWQASAKTQMRNPVQFQGWVSNLDIAYRRFDLDMTPTRAEVDISLYVTAWMPTATQLGFFAPAVPRTRAANSGFTPRVIRNPSKTLTNNPNFVDPSHKGPQ